MLSAIARGGETSIRRKGKGKPLGPGTFLPPEAEGRLLLSDPRLIDPARYATMARVQGSFRHRFCLSRLSPLPGAPLICIQQQWSLYT